MKTRPLLRTAQVLLLLPTMLVLNNCATTPAVTPEAAPSAAKPSAEKADSSRTQKTAAPAADPFADVYRYKALNYEKAEELLKAIEMWKIVSSLSPADREAIKKIDTLQRQAAIAAESHFTNGVAFYKKGAEASARKEFLLTLAYNPDHQDALDYLKNKLAGEDYVQYVVKKGDTLQSIAQKFYNDPQKDFLISYFNDFDKQTKLIPEMNIKIPVVETSEPEKTSEGDDTTAEEEGEPSVKTADMDITALLAKGMAFLKAKQYQEALSVAQSILKLKQGSKNSAALNIVNVSNYEMGKIATTGKQYSEALKYFSRVHPGYRDVKNVILTTKNLLAEVYYNTGVKSYVNDKIEQAIRDWQETLKLNPKHPRARRDIENAQSLLKKIQKIK